MDKFFGPKKINMQGIAIDSLGTFVTGIIGGIIVLISISLISKQIGLNFNLGNLNGIKVNNVFPFLLSIITLIATIITMVTTYFMLTITNPTRYIKSTIVVVHILIFCILTYILLTPVYLTIGEISYINILYIFLGHNLITILGTRLIIEFLNNYRYVLLSFYGSFIGFFITIFIILFIYANLSTSQSKILSVVIVLPLINLLSNFFSQLFELLYFKYYSLTGNDPLGDIFYQIEKENKF